MANVRTPRETQVPGIPSISTVQNIDPTLREFLASLAEAVDIRLGRRGDNRDRAITLRELIDSGLAVELRTNPYKSSPGVPPTPGSTIQPTAPTGVIVTGGYSVIQCYWDYPSYVNHAHTEIWRYDSDSIGDAVLVGVSPGTSFIDPVGGGASYYYWFRHVSAAGVTGPWYSSAGELGETAPDVDLILDLLEGAISESQLVTSLADTISLITDPSSVTGSVAWHIAQEVSARNAAIAAEAAAVRSEVDADILILQGQISDLQAVEDYDNATAYVVGDLVKSGGYLYRCIANTTGNAPPNATYWELLGEYSSLGAAVANNTSNINQINFVDASSTSAIALAVHTLNATVGDSGSGLFKAVADIESDYMTSADTSGAIAAALTTFASSTAFNDAADGRIDSALVSYTNTADLQLYYYTKTQADSAIAGALTTWKSSTEFKNAVNGEVDLALGDYTTTALLETNYYTKTEADTATSVALTTWKSTTEFTNAVNGEIDAALGDYTTTATLETNYYTKTEANTAISGALTTWKSSTEFTNAVNGEIDAALGIALGDYTTTATLETNYYTVTEADSAISTALTVWKSTTEFTDAVNGEIGTALEPYATAAEIALDYYTKTDADSAIAGQITQFKTDYVDANFTTTAALELNYYTKAEADVVEGQYTVKIDVNGRVAGFGLANTSASYDGGIHSEFAVRADRFEIVNTNTNATITPFVVTTVTTTLNGVSVPAGVYISEAYIKNGAISQAKIGNAAVDTAQIADLAVSTGKIDNLAVTEAKIQNLAVTEAKIGNAAITTAKIQDLSVDTIKITGDAVSQSANSYSLASASDSVTFTSRGGTVLIWATFFPTGTSTRTYYIKRGSTTLRSMTLNSVTSPVFMYVDTPPAGSVTYSAECSVSCNRIEIQVLEVLR